MALHSDRPLRRTLVKLACQLFLGNGRAHYHSWLPSLRIEDRRPGHAGVVWFRNRPVLSLFSSEVLSKRIDRSILIVGSGPSVKGQSLAAVSKRSTILLNGAISLIGEEIADPLAIAIEDERFVWRHFPMIREKVARGNVCLFSAGVLNAICILDQDWLRERVVVLIDNIAKPYGRPRRSLEELQALSFVHLSKETGFSEEPDRGVFQGGSVAISALQFALATHAGEIGFLGVDISNANAPRFYETPGEVAFSGIAGAERRILAHIALAKAFAERKGVRLVNHSPVSALRSIGLEFQPLDHAAP